jgi:hypothetical protein
LLQVLSLSLSHYALAVNSKIIERIGDDNRNEGEWEIEKDQEDRLT